MSATVLGGETSASPAHEADPQPERTAQMTLPPAAPPPSPAPSVSHPETAVTA
jgi:hypothetical protein